MHHSVSFLICGFIVLFLFLSIFMVIVCALTDIFRCVSHSVGVYIEILKDFVYMARERGTIIVSLFLVYVL